MNNDFIDSKTVSPSNVQVIWNITKICGWDCEFCCVDATHVKRTNSNIIIRTHCLSKIHNLKFERSMDTYELANKFLIKKGMELSLFEKLMVLNNIDLNSEIDFSGGDPLLLKDNLTIIEKASNKFGKEKISITATGIGFSRIDPDLLINIVGNIDFTYDSIDNKDVPFRPDSYNASNLKKVSLFKKRGFNITAQIPLSLENISPKAIENIYMNLHENGIDNILLMKIFPVGRGSNMKLPLPSINDYKIAIDTLKSLENIYKYPAVKIQTALQKLLDNNSPFDLDFSSSHLVITQRGILSSSPWALNKFGEPLPAYIIGDLKKESLSNLFNITLKKEKKYESLIYYFTNKAASIFY
jgi:MoaA/NifB/PqqE/SkfB family radical SAM enzyme